jgi:ATP synthase regulation protein NCA2
MLVSRVRGRGVPIRRRIGEKLGKCVRRIEAQLIQGYEAASMQSGHMKQSDQQMEDSPLSALQLGLLLLSAYELEQTVRSHTSGDSQHRQVLLDDLTMLRSLQFSIQQKLLVVNRIRTSSAFNHYVTQ